MNQRRRLFIRVDATLSTGLGHFMRCFAIAQRWHADYGPVTFLGTFNVALHDELRREGFDAIRLPSMCPDSGDVETTIAVIDAGGPVILDGYHFDYAYQRRLADHARLLVIDDLGHLPRYAGAMLLNATVNAADIVYAEAPTRRLLGLRYAMLRRGIVAARNGKRRAAGALAHVLVSLGGADAANDTLRVLRAMSLQAGAVRVVVGPLSPHVAAMREFAAEHANVAIVDAPASMPDEMLAADFAIGSAGTICLELACLGIPCILFAIADNQLAIGPAMEQAGAAIFGGDIRCLDEHELAAVIGAALTDVDRHETMRTAGPSLVDGLGPERICRELSGVLND
jgi:UDP-2,4-diacetamido-2,4,6-trideoxy-beta-L-altropyranose hydrolase